MKSLETAKHIRDLATKAGIEQIFLVGNKIENEIQAEAIKNFAEKNGLEILDFVPFDQKVVEAEMQGETPLKYKEAEAIIAIEKLCERLMAENT
jgi:CO dehydrogenase maturation factor